MIHVTNHSSFANAVTASQPDDISPAAKPIVLFINLHALDACNTNPQDTSNTLAIAQSLHKKRAILFLITAKIDDQNCSTKTFLYFDKFVV